MEGSEIFYPHTGVIVSVSQGSESNLVKTTTGLSLIHICTANPFYGTQIWIQRKAD